MKLMPLVNAVLLTWMTTAPAWAIYKCQDAQGHASFQQMPCTGAMHGQKMDVQPASGNRPAPPTTETAASAAALPSETERLNALSGRLAKENRLSTLNNLIIDGAHGDIQRARQRCAAEIAAVRNRKASASNDLAGATWEQSLSTEMQAIAAQCDTEQRLLHANLERYTKEKQDLERELAKP